MNIGSLYQVKKYFWLLFPKVEYLQHLDDARGAVVSIDADGAADYAAWYSSKYNCVVSWFSPDSLVACLEEDGNFKKVLTSEGLVGWTWFGERDNECFEEVINNP